MNNFFIFFTTLGDMGMIWIALIIGLLIYKPTRKFGLLCALALIIEFVLNDFILKPLIARDRPFIQDPSIELLIKAPSGYSMPSGHSASSMVIAGMFIFFKQKGRWLVLLLAAIIAYSRIYLQVHFVSDVIVGTLLGLTIAYTFSLKFSKEIN